VSIDRGCCCTRGLREVRACQSRVCEVGVQPGRPYDKTCQNTHLEKLLDTGVVDHPVEEYVTRAQMTHFAHLTRRTCRPLKYLYSLAPCAENQKGFMSSTIHGGSVHVMVFCFVLCTFHSFVFCAVYKALSMSKLCALCFGTRHGPA
jgi:hypothetical protein